jgi:periplasmic protein TonB
MLKSTIVSIGCHLFVVSTCLLIGYLLPVKDKPCFVDLTLVSLKSEQEHNENTENRPIAVKQKREKQINSVVPERIAEEHPEINQQHVDSIVLTQPDTSILKTDSNIQVTDEGKHMVAEQGIVSGKNDKAASEGDTARISFSGKNDKMANDFSYIASIISRNTRYPRFAEELGISGTVVLEFVVSKEGVVNDVAIVKSSGYDILDKDAIKTVKISSPFPSSRVTAKIMFPMEYRLTSTD